MRALMYADGVRIDLITDDEDLLKVVRLATAAGFVDMTIDQSGEGDTKAVHIRAPQGAFAARALAMLLAVVAEIDRTTPEQVLAQARTRNPAFGVTVDAMHKSV